MKSAKEKSRTVALIVSLAMLAGLVALPVSATESEVGGSTTGVTTIDLGDTGEEDGWGGTILHDGQARAVNRNGLVVGVADDGSPKLFAYDLMAEAPAIQWLEAINLGSLFPYVSSLNDAGMIVGTGINYSGPDHAFFYVPDGQDGPTVTVSLEGYVNGYYASWAEAVNADGIVVGRVAYAVDGETYPEVRAFVYDPTGDDVIMIEGTYAAYDVSGDIVVGSSASNRPFAYDLDEGAMIPIPFSTAYTQVWGGSAIAVNEAGVVVGWVHNESWQHRAFTWTVGDDFVTDLGEFAGVEDGWCMPVAVSQEGVIVGSCWDPGAAYRAFYYDTGAANPVMTDLGDLGSGWEDAEYTVTGVSDAGVIVGYAYGDGYGYRAYFYDFGATTPVMTGLPTLGGDQSRADAVVEVEGLGTVVVGEAYRDLQYSYGPVAWILGQSEGPGDVSVVIGGVKVKGATVEVSFAVDGDYDELYCWLDEDLYLGACETDTQHTFTSVPQGTHTVYVQADSETDSREIVVKSGKVKQEPIPPPPDDTLTVTITSATAQRNGPITVIFEASGGETGSEYEFTCKATPGMEEAEPCGVDEWTWVYPDEGEWLAGGKYEITVTVTDGVETVSVEKTVRVSGPSKTK